MKDLGLSILSQLCMSKARKYWIYCIPFLWVACQPAIPEGISQAYDALPEEIDFNFHIRPLLADRCYACHGPDDNTREAGLRLDLEKEAFARLKESNGYAFVKGSLRKSKAWKRIIDPDPEITMPPPESHLSLSNKEKALIGKWIEQGAEWKTHWAFTPPEKTGIFAVGSTEMKNPIDYFVEKRLKSKGLTTSEGAGKEQLIRRVSFDIRGLPPSLQEIDSFLDDNSKNAYEELVDQWLETDAHAERMALEWLDVARFGDTQGLHVDPERYNWPWRDWVIGAFRENMPYDEFITWQMAGDLLPKASQQQKLATAFHRNHPTSSEGGIPDEEFRQKYVQDRTNTTATAFLGLTLECATCHDHKFDPISQKEYYQVSAFFNNLKEIGMVNEYKVKKEGGGPVFASGPTLLLTPKETEATLMKLEEELLGLERRKKLRSAEVRETQEFLEFAEHSPIPIPQADAYFPFEKIGPYKPLHGVVHRIQNNAPIGKIVDQNVSSLASGEPLLVEGVVGQALSSPEEVDIVFLKEEGIFDSFEPFSAGVWARTEKSGEFQSLMGTSGAMGNAWRGWDFFLDTLNRPSINLVSIRPHNFVQITADKALEKEEWNHLLFTYDGTMKAEGLALYVNGRKVATHTVEDNLYGTIRRRWRKRGEWEERPMMLFRSGRYHTGENGVFTGQLDEVRLFHKWLSSAEIYTLWLQDKPAIKQAPAFTKDEQLAFFLSQKDSVYRNLVRQYSKVLAQKIQLLEKVPEIMVMEEMEEARPTFVLDRGQYNSPTEQVQAGTPSALMEFPEEYAKNRLGLAKWLIDARNPLTARVAVNRYWQMIFGRGLVETPHDFGTQGALPSHPDLLDWLAIDFVESGWDLRRLLKLMLTSNTYRQSSIADSRQRESDPENIWLSRGPSYRMDAEMIRDNVLAASGLLTQKIGGPSVKPYQPAGVWDFGVLVSGPYEESRGEDLYRRSIYTYIRRTSPHPAMVAFDAPNRLVCITKRERTNTPLQALVLLNDPEFVEAARVLAGKIVSEGGDNVEDQLRYGFRLLCGRWPDEKEFAVLSSHYKGVFSWYEKNPKEAEKLLTVGRSPNPPDYNLVALGAMTALVNSLMSFDEVYMKR